MLWREVIPCFRELREDISRVSAVLGPFDLAPLARAVSDFSCEGIIISLNPRLIPALGDLGSPRWDGVVGIGCYLLDLGVTEKFRWITITTRRASTRPGLKVIAKRTVSEVRSRIPMTSLA